MTDCRTRPHTLPRLRQRSQAPLRPQSQVLPTTTLSRGRPQAPRLRLQPTWTPPTPRHLQLRLPQAPRRHSRRRVARQRTRLHALPRSRQRPHATLRPQTLELPPTMLSRGQLQAPRHRWTGHAPLRLQTHLLPRTMLSRVQPQAPQMRLQPRWPPPTPRHLQGRLPQAPRRHSRGRRQGHSLSWRRGRTSGRQVCPP